MNAFETQILANRLAQGYVMDSSDLNEQIAKHAEENDLSRVQIQGLVSAVNHATNDILRKTAEDKTYTFELGNLDSVLEILKGRQSEGAPLAKVASAVRSLNPDTGVGANLAAWAANGSPEEQDRRLRTAGDTLQKIAATCGAHKNRVSAKKVGTMKKLAEDIASLTQTVKEYMINGHYPYEDIKKCAHAVNLDNDKVVDMVFEKVASELEKLGHPFTGVLASDKELKGETFKRSGGDVPEPEVTVVNGASPIAKEVKAIGSRVRSSHELDRTFNELDSLASTALIAEKSLKDNMAVSEYLCQDLDSVYRACQTMCAQEDLSAKQVKEAASKLTSAVKALAPGALATGVTTGALAAGNVAAGELRRQSGGGIKQPKTNNPTKTV
jgi:hypothetical protein